MRPSFASAIVVSAFLLSVAPGFAAAPPEFGLSADLEVMPEAADKAAPPPPPLRLAERERLAPLAFLEPSAQVAVREIEQMILWNRLKLQPQKNGFARSFSEARRVEFGPELAGRTEGALGGGAFRRTETGALIWGGEARVAGAQRLRLHLAELDLPEGARLWVYGNQETIGPFGTELRSPAGDLWTPSVAGESIRLEVELPAGGTAHASFLLDRVLELFTEAADSETLFPRGGSFGQCLINARCATSTDFAELDAVRKGVAHLQFVDNCPDGIGLCSFVCTGGLVADLDTTTTIPYLLTANHCFRTQSSATTLEAFWDFFSSSCGGSVPALASLPRSNGSTLLASSQNSDFTFVRLNGIPAGRTLLGWNATQEAVGNGTTLHRVHIPCDPNAAGCVPLPQQYSRNHIDTGFTASGCEVQAPRARFHYSTYDTGRGDKGGSFGGSSGSPALISGGRIVGQLFGGCGLNPEDGCDYANAEVDGAFFATFPSIAGFLDPSADVCVPGPTTACLVGGRFRVQMTFRLQGGATTPANVAPAGSDNSALFFFNNANNWELLLKVLNGCGLNSRYWIFYAATTNVAFTITVTDTESSTTKTYTNALGNAAPPIQDTLAFATCP